METLLVGETRVLAATNVTPTLLLTSIRRYMTAAYALAEASQNPISLAARLSDNIVEL